MMKMTIGSRTVAPNVSIADFNPLRNASIYFSSPRGTFPKCAELQNAIISSHVSTFQKVNRAKRQNICILYQTKVE